MLTLVRRLPNSISQFESSEQEGKRAGKESEAGGAQYRPIMKSLDRPAPRGRLWEFLIGGKRKWVWPVSVEVIGQIKEEKIQRKQPIRRSRQRVTLIIPSGPELHTRTNRRRSFPPNRCAQDRYMIQHCTSCQTGRVWIC